LIGALDVHGRADNCTRRASVGEALQAIEVKRIKISGPIRVLAIGAERGTPLSRKWEAGCRVTIP
jgi:hypothetical protein